MHDNVNCQQAPMPELASGNIYIRKCYLAQKGYCIQGHVHNFDHTTIFIRGSVHIEVRKDGECVLEQDFYPGQHCLIAKDLEHKIIALENNVYFMCVYSHRDPQGRVVQEMTGWDAVKLHPSYM